MEESVTSQRKLIIVVLWFLIRVKMQCDLHVYYQIMGLIINILPGICFDCSSTNKMLHWLLLNFLMFFIWLFIMGFDIKILFRFSNWVAQFE